MKKNIALITTSLALVALAGCDGVAEPHEHTFKQEWETNETHHWHNASCEHTDLVKDLNTHNFGDDNVCNDCGYTKPAPVVEHEHTFATGWTHDETNHWHAASCEHTELTSGLAAHNYGVDNICDDCGYEKPTPVVPHEHSFSEDWSKDETNHWHAATCEHNELISGLAAHKYGDDNICDDCGYTKPAPAHEHSFSEDWSIDETNHWHASTCGHNVNSLMAEHSFNKDNKCTVCGYEKIIPHTHTFATKWSYDDASHWKDATCEHNTLNSERGAHIDLNEDGQCDVCEYVLPAPAHEHSFATEWTHDETNHWHASTCEHTELTSGLAAHNFNGDDECDDCGYTKPSPAHEHSFATEWTHDETNHWHAAACEHTDLTSGLEAHDFGDGNVCKDCGYEKPAPAHIHSFSTEWLKDEAKHWHASTCGHNFVEGLEDHTYGANNICTVCGFKKIEKHKITYANWPDEIENPNPTDFLRTDDFVLDGSNIEEKEGFSNVKFMVDENEVTTLTGIDKDVTVTVTYDVSVTKMTINPDNDRDESFDINVSYWSKPSDLIGEFSRSGHDFVYWVDGEGNKVNIDERWENLDSTFTLTAKWKFIAIDKYISNLEEYKSSLIVEAAKGVGEDPTFASLVDQLDSMMKIARNELLLKEYTKAEADEIVAKHEKQLNTAAVIKVLPVLTTQFMNEYSKKMSEVGGDPIKMELVTTYFTSNLSFGGPDAKMKDVILSYQVAMIEINKF